MYLFLVLTILFTRTSCTRNPIILYPCCMVVRRSCYLTRPFDYILVKVSHCSLIGWERHATASQERLALTGELVWRQAAQQTRVTRRVVVTTPLTVTMSLASEPKPPPLLGTLTGTLIWSGTPVIGLTRLSTRWKGSDNSSDRLMTLHTCKRRWMPASTHRLA
jgi:hypothetical protein